jgi:hypothetical protein
MDWRKGYGKSSGSTGKPGTGVGRKERSDEHPHFC